MKKKLRVAVLFGGRSGEHEVSIVSARSIIRSLNRERYEVIPLAISKEGKWMSPKVSQQYLETGAAAFLARSKQFALTDLNQRTMSLVRYEKGKQSPEGVQNVDVFFPVLHGTYGEDGRIQGVFEMMDKPYVGCGVLGSAVGMDKIVQKRIFEAEELSIVPYAWCTKREWREHPERVRARIKTLGLPVFVKPANLGSSVGITKAHTPEEVTRAMNLAARYDRRIIIEQAVLHARELECAVLGNDDPKASGIGEVVPSNEFYDYDAKYVDGKSSLIIPAKLSKQELKTIRTLAVRAFLSLDLAGMARVDFLMNRKTGKIVLNEVNTIPGFTSISMYPKLWEAAGVSYPKLLDMLIELALKRHAEQEGLATSFDPKKEWFTS